MLHRGFIHFVASYIGFMFFTFILKQYPAKGKRLF